MCSLCRIDSDGGSYCPGCFERLSEEGALPSVRTAYRDYGRLAYHTGLLGTLMFPTMIFGPLAIWFGIVGLRSYERSGARLSRGRCYLGIVLGILGLLLATGFVILIAAKP